MATFSGRSSDGLIHHPGDVLGYTADGAPIYPIAGAEPPTVRPGNAPAPGADAPGNGERGTVGDAPTLTHSGCINRLQDIRSQMSSIAELANPSAQDDEYFRELEREFDTVDAHRLRLERSATLARVRGTADGLNAAGFLRAERGAGGERHDGSQGYDRDAIMEPDSIEDARFRNPWATEEMRTMGRDPMQVAAEFRARALSACAAMPGANDAVRKAATAIVEDWDDQDANLSQLTLALSAPAYFRAWSKLARSEGQVSDLAEEERNAVARVRHVARSTRAMSLTDAAGGYLVPFQLDPTVILTANGSVNQIRQIARQVVATGDRWHGVSAGAVAWSYDGEASEVSDDSPTFGQVFVDIYKAQGFVPISIEALQDAANVAVEVGRLLAFGKDVLEASAFAVGSGVNMPTGIVTALAGGPQVINAGTAGTLGVDDLFRVQGALPARYRNQAAWLANNLIYNQIRGFGADANVWGNVEGNTPAQLLGKPHYEAEDMDGVVGTGVNNVLIHGDFSNYVIADRIGMTVEFIPHLFHVGNNRPTGQRGWMAYVRHGADSVNDAGFRMLNVAGAA